MSYLVKFIRITCCFPDAPEADRSSPTPSWFSGTNNANNSGWGPSTSWGPTSTTWAPTGNTGGPAANTWSGNAWGAAGGHWGAAGLVDSEALIAVELCLVKGDGDSEDLRIANILFNNLDIIGELNATISIRLLQMV